MDDVVNERAMRWVKNFCKIKVDGFPVTEWFRYDFHSLWYVVEPWMNVQSPYFNSVTDALQNVKRKKSLLRFLVRHSFLPKFYARKFVIGKNMHEPVDVVLAAHTMTIRGGTDTMCDQLREEFVKEGMSVSVVYYDDNASLGFRTLRLRKRRPYVHSIESFANRESMGTAKYWVSHFRDTWKVMKGKEDYKRYVDGKDILFKRLRERLDFVLVRVMQEAITHIILTKMMIHQLKPKMVVSMNFPTIIGRCVTVASKEAGIPIVGVQAGIMSRSLYYCHSKYDVLHGYPKPDATFVYGEYSKRFLKKCANYGG